MLNLSDPFYSSKFGIEWANDHITELDRETKTFLDSKPCTIVREIDGDGVYKLLKFKLTKPMPRALTGHALDVAHSLRAALDQAIYAIATLHGSFSGTPYFPIRNTVDEFERAMKSLSGKLPQEISDLMSTFKPYKGGNNLIWALNKLCGANKHGIIRPMAMKAGLAELSGTSKGSPVQIPLHPEWDAVKNEMILVRIPIDGEHTVNLDYSFFIGFDDIEFIDGQPVIPILGEFLDIVNGIVMAIEAETVRIGLI